MNNTTQDMNNQSLHHNNPLRFLLRFTVLLAVTMAWLTPAKAQTHDIFVFQSDGHYLAHFGSEVQVSLSAQVTAPTTFNPNTCLWDTIKNASNKTYLRAYSTESFETPYYLNTAPSSTYYFALLSTFPRELSFEVGANINLRTWPKSLIGGSYPSHYYRYHPTYGWIAAENNAATPYSATANTSAYQVTVTENVGSYQGPVATITGAGELTDFGTFGYSASSSITTVSYDNYEFNSANHYWYENSDHGNTAPVDWSGTLTSTWSIADNGGCATIDADGNLTVHKLPATDRILTLQLTVTDGTRSCVFTKDVVLRGTGCYVLKDDLGNYVSLDGVNIGASTTFHAYYSKWDAEANVISNYPYGIAYSITSVGGIKYYLTVANSNTEARVTSSFNAGNCRWTGIVSDYYNYLKSAGNYYVYRNSSVWKLTQDASTAHLVKALPVTSELGHFTYVSGVINGDYGEINLLGDYSFTAIPSINNGQYDIYTFGGVAHYWYGGSDHASSPETWGNITVGDLTKTWSLASGGETYASVNSATGELTINELPASGTVTITLVCTITDEGGTHSFQVTKGVVLGVQETVIHSLDYITDHAGHYRLAADFSTTGTIGQENGVSIGSSTNPFTGTINGNMTTITGTWNKPLFDYISGATIKNVIIQEVGISSGTNVGAIAGNADGASRIYNCGILKGSVGGTNNVGGLVGKLDGTSRVINCYSFANITAGAVKAGIVGYNNYASKYNDLKTMVMNCMFYGNIDYSSGNVYPIYGGNEISNDYKASGTNRLNNYNYFLYEAPFSKNNNTNNTIITAYNCALAAEERFLVRFEFYRHLLNSNRELATWYVTGSTSNAYNTMQKWVLDKEIAKYPILKPYGTYPSVVNYDPTYTFNPTTGAKVERANVTTPNQGGIVTSLGNNGYLTINIREGNGGVLFTQPSGASLTTFSLNRPIVDKDTAQYNFNYGKVQLPYYNEVGTGNYTGNRVVTGWKIVDMTGGTTGGYSETDYDAPNFNYADRDHTGKDLYGTSGRIFAQGSYFNVPTGVTAITIEPYWACCAYLSNKYYDRYGYKTTDDLSQIGGLRYTNGNNYSINGDEQKVYTTFANARDAMSYPTGATVYDCVVVLVGNYHHHTDDGAGNGDELSNVSSKPLTVTSIDNNRDNEPDYCLIFRSGKQKEVCPIRYDFITLPGMAMAMKMATHTNLAIPGNCKPKGWFEITTTGLIKFGQFEHSYESKTLAPLIFMGGVIDQFVSNNSGDDITRTNKTRYFLFGDNVWFQLLSNGTHADHISPTPHRPISITGGQYDILYLSGYFKPEANVCTEAGGDRNAECYIDGGKFNEVAGAGQEQIDGDVTWLIDHADIKQFFGGGINSEKAITGDIHTTIKNSRVNQFCGGPKFGNMNHQTTPKKTITTEATNCTFGTYFGGGYGGTSIYRERIQNEWTLLNYDSGNKDWNKWIADSYDKPGANSYRGKYRSGMGVSMGYDYEFFGGSKGNVARLYIQYASFSLARVNDVTSTLDGCTILENYYGGGSFGAVAGNAISTLNNCTVYGNVFGAGYSVQTPTVKVFNNGGFSPAPPYYNTKTGVYEGGEDILPASVTYTWAHGSVSSGSSALVEDNHTIKTNETITGLGEVNGDVTITLSGTTTVGTADDDTSGHVFGGGEESKVTGNVSVILQGSAHVLRNVYGGGDEGVVTGNTSVTIQAEP